MIPSSAKPAGSQAQRPQPQPSASALPHGAFACRCPQLIDKNSARRVACGIAPEALQDIIVGGAVVGAVGAALTWGLKKDPVPCSLCQGTGGIKCFGCSGEGRMGSAKRSRDDLFEAPPKRDVLGRSIDPRECKVCKGVGLVLCSQCNGSGFQGV